MYMAQKGRGMRWVKLWDVKCREQFNLPLDVRVIHNVIPMRIRFHSSEQLLSIKPGITRYRAPRQGYKACFAGLGRTVSFGFPFGLTELVLNLIFRL